MKNVTVTLDDETHRRARIHAAELGTSLSALVRSYLQSLGDASYPETAQPAVSQGVREMPLPYLAQPAALAGAVVGAAQTKFSTKHSTPRTPGALKGKIWVADDFDETPDWLIDAFEGKDSHLPWPDAG